MSWREYNGDTMHDMYVDGFYANCESDSYSGYDRPLYYAPGKRKPQKSTPIQNCERKIGKLKEIIIQNKQRIRALEANLAILKEGTRRYRKALDRLILAKKQLETDTKKLEEQTAKLAMLKANFRRRLIIGIIIASICIPIIIISIIVSL